MTLVILALMKANGEWVGFLDVDDLWFPEKLKKQMEEIANVGEDVGLSYSRCELFRDTVTPAKFLAVKKSILAVRLFLKKTSQVNSSWEI